MNLSLILPELTLFVGALLILVGDVFFAKKIKEYFLISHLASLILCVLSLFFIVINFASPQIGFHEMFVSNSLTSFVKAVSVLLLAIVIMISLNFIFSASKISAEFIALLMTATVGGMILISANDFLVFYLGLELQALSLYLLAGFNRSSINSSESAVKYFILGALASGILLFGISMIYGFSGATNFTTLASIYTNSQSPVPAAVVFGFVLVIMALFFKVSAAPFHMWAPDVYEGAPTIVTTFFASAIKFTSLLVLIKLLSTLFVGFPGMNKIFLLVSILSIAVGSFAAIFQKNLKRLLAYSSVAHVGFILLALACANSTGFKFATFYAFIYALISIGTFAFLNLMISANPAKSQDDDEENKKIFDISSLAGLSKTNPVMAFSFTILIFSTAGIPPMAGFFSKFYVITAALSSYFIIPAVIAIVLSVVSSFYYLRIVKIMYFDEPSKAIKIDEIGNIKFIVFACAALNLFFVLFMNKILFFISNIVS